MNNGKLGGFSLKLVVPAIAFAMALPAHGTMVTYSTTGGFSASGGGSSAVFTLGANNATLSFNGVTNATVNASPMTFASAGSIQVQTASTTGVPVGGTFTLGISQTAPSSNSGSLLGNLTGTVTFSSSSGDLEFTSTALTLGNVTYTLLAPGGGYELVPPTTNNGVTTLEMMLAVSNPVPEPTFFALTGFGFAGMGLLAFRRFRRSV
jgi:hypothetical protein